MFFWNAYTGSVEWFGHFWIHPQLHAYYIDYAPNQYLYLLIPMQKIHLDRIVSFFFAMSAILFLNSSYSSKESFLKISIPYSFSIWADTMAYTPNIFYNYHVPFLIEYLISKYPLLYNNIIENYFHLRGIIMNNHYDTFPSRHEKNFFISYKWREKSIEETNRIQLETYIILKLVAVLSHTWTELAHTTEWYW